MISTHRWTDCGPTWVYVHLADETVLYVGMTFDMQRRQGQHRRTSPWWSQITDTVRLGPFDDRQQAADFEGELLAALEPPNNRAGTPRDSRRAVAGAA